MFVEIHNYKIENNQQAVIDFAKFYVFLYKNMRHFNAHLFLKEFFLEKIYIGYNTKNVF